MAAATIHLPPDDAGLLIVGAGAMGSFIAARLAEAKIDVTLVDKDPRRLETIAKYGLPVLDEHGERTIHVRAVPACDVAGHAGLILLLTKGHHSHAALASVRQCIGPETTGLSLQNGLDNEQAFQPYFQMERVLLGCTDLPADLDREGRVSSSGRGGIILGPATGRSLQTSERTANLFRRAGLNAQAVMNVATPIWEKVAFNASLNPLAAASGLPAGGLGRPAGWDIVNAVIAEIARLAAAEGVAFDAERVRGRIGRALRAQPHHLASMLQDRLAGRLSEIEHISGALEARARARAIAAPTLTALANIVRLIDADLARRASDGFDAQCE